MKDSWLNPNGEIIDAVSFGGHRWYAEAFFEKEYNKSFLLLEDELGTSDACKALHKRGWVRIQVDGECSPILHFCGNDMDFRKPMRNTIDPPMNEMQLRVAKDLCRKYEISFHKAINEKMYW